MGLAPEDLCWCMKYRRSTWLTRALMLRSPARRTKTMAALETLNLPGRGGDPGDPGG